MFHQHLIYKALLAQFFSFAVRSLPQDEWQTRWPISRQRISLRPSLNGTPSRPTSPSTSSHSCHQVNGQVNRRYHDPIQEEDRPSSGRGGHPTATAKNPMKSKFYFTTKNSRRYTF